MIDLRNYRGLYLKEILELGYNTKIAKELKNYLSVLQNIIYNNFYFSNPSKSTHGFYFADLVLKKIGYENNILTMDIMPIYPDGKTDRKLYLYVAERLNAVNFPFYLELKNIDSSSPKIIFKFLAQQRVIDSTKYSKGNFDKKLLALQKGYGDNRNIFLRAMQTVFISYYNVTRLRTNSFVSNSIKFYIPNYFFTNDMQEIQRAYKSNTLTDIYNFLKNPLPSLKKPLLYAGGAFLVYTVVKEAAKKHL